VALQSLGIIRDCGFGIADLGYSGSTEIMGLLSTAFRAHPANIGPEKAWELGLLGGTPSYTGKTVTEESALTFSAVWSAVTQLA